MIFQTTINGQKNPKDPKHTFTKILHIWSFFFQIKFYTFSKQPKKNQKKKLRKRFDTWKRLWKNDDGDRKERKSPGIERKTTNF